MSDDTDTSTALAALGLADPDEQTRTHVRAGAAAEVDGPQDVAYRVVESPVGPLLLAMTGRGLVRVAYEAEDHERVLTDLAASVSPRVRRSPGRLDGPVRQLEAYFAGGRRRFDLPLDLRLAQGFRRRVLDHLLDIPYGRTASYGEVAASAGSPRAVRAVGTACATNPLPVVVPCHRVLRSNGGLGGYLGGEAAKRALLALEAGRRANEAVLMPRG